MPGIEPMLAMVVPWFLVVARVAGLFVFAPMLSSMVLPMRARAMLAAAVGLAAAPLVLQVQGQLDAATASPSIYSLAWLLLSETLIGLSIGMIAMLPLIALDLAGTLMGHQMGLNLARVYNPETDAEIDAIGQMLFYVGFASFIAVNGLESTFLALLDTFDRVPIGTFNTSMLPLDLLVGVVSSGVELAVRIAAPAWGAVALLMVIIGFLSKFMPQLNTMTIGFMLKIVLGIGVLAASMRIIGEVSIDAMNETFAAIGGWIQTL